MSTVANEDMARAWDGEEGARWAEHAERYEATGPRQWKRLVDTGLISAADAVLDIGCGTGKSTRDAARLASGGSALGVDLSARMLARARELAESVKAAQADADAAADVLAELERIRSGADPAEIRYDDSTRSVLPRRAR